MGPLMLPPPHFDLPPTIKLRQPPSTWGKWKPNLRLSRLHPSTAGFPTKPSLATVFPELLPLPDTLTQLDSLATESLLTKSSETARPKSCTVVLPCWPPLATSLVKVSEG